MKQPENVGTAVDLMRYRLDRAESDIKSAKVLIEAEEIRHASDYDDFYIAIKEETLELLETAETLLGQIKDYCRNRIENS